MNYRTVDLLAETALTGASVKDIPVNVAEIISRLRLTWRTSPSKHGMDSYCHADVTKIELVDGSDVLFSMNGGQAQALNIYNRRCPTMNYGQHMMGNSQLSEYAIDFGRFLNDPQLALDPTRFKNLMLKVTYDVDLSDTGVTTGNLRVVAEVFDEKPVNPIGFLMSKEHYNATPPASGYVYIELPLDYPLRDLLVQGYRSAYEPWYQVSEIRLDEDNLKRTPFDWVLETYYRMMRGQFAPVEELMVGLTGAATKTYYVTPTDYWMTPVLIERNAHEDLYVGATSRGGKVDVTCALSGGGFHGTARGYLPNHCFEFPMGNQQDIDDWYDVTKLGSLRARLKAGSGGASGTLALITQQLRRY